MLAFVFLSTTFNISKNDTFAETTGVTFTAIDGTVNSKTNENYDKALDGKKFGSSFTKWCYDIDANPYIVIKASTNVIVTGYVFTSGNDNADSSKGAGRNPSTWTFSACNDYNESTKNGTWQVIDSKTDDTTMKDVNFTDYTFNISTNKSYYRYYKFQFTKVQGNVDLFQLSEIALNYSTTCIEHTYGTWVDEVPATCTNAGTKGYKTCTYCNKNFDSNNVEITDLTLPAGHNFGTWVDEVPASCTNAGTKGYKVCSKCNLNFDQDNSVIENLTLTKLSHDFQAIENENHIKKSATCTHCAEYYKYCISCGEEDSETFMGSAPLGHSVNSNNQCDRCGRYIGTVVGNFGVIGGANNVDYRYENNTLSILTSTQLTITQIDLEKSITDTILITKDVQANIVLAEINIDVSSQTNKSPIVIEQSSTASVTITIQQNTTTILKSGTNNEGIKRFSHTQSLIINNNGNLIVSALQSSAIDGGYVSEGVKDIVLNGGFIKLSGSPKFGNTTKSVIPVNADGQNLYEFEIPNSGKYAITIDETNANDSYYNKASGGSYFTYISGTTHTIVVGYNTTIYHYANSTFSPCSEGTTYGQDADEHWTKCFFEDCDVKYNTQRHNYYQRVKTAEYLKSEPTCTENRLYYYSCVCGKRTPDDNDYFGDSDTKLGHNYTKPDGSTNWSGTDSHHWKVCVRCNYEYLSDIAGHNFDKRCGDCTCLDCGKVVAKDHNILREYHWMYDATTHWYGCHFRTENCDYRDSEASHNFVYIASDDDGYHVKRCSICYYVDETSKQACTPVITSKLTTIHIYSCDICRTELSRDDHIYDSVCDTDCNICLKVREPIHQFDSDCDTECNLCHITREAKHSYSDDCDETCNNCGYIRTVNHNYGADLYYDEFYHYYLCEDCWSATKDVAKHIYDDNNDLTCNICGYERGTPITELKFFLMGYRFGNGINYTPEIMSYSDNIESYLEIYFSEDERLIEFGQNYSDYIIYSYSDFFVEKVYYCYIPVTPEDGYDIGSLLKENVQLVVNGTTITAENILLRLWGGAPCAFIGFKLPKLEAEGQNKVESDLEFKLTGYEFGNKAKDISVELLSDVVGINFNSNATYGENFFITNSSYTSRMFSKMVDGETELEKNKVYYLALVFNTKLNYYFYGMNDVDITLQNCGYMYDMYYTYNDCLVVFRLHALESTIIDNLNFTYSNYELNAKITDIKVDYTQAIGITSGESYFNEDEYEYNYLIVTNLNQFLSNSYSEFEKAYVSIYDNGRFVSNEQYYLAICVTPESSSYSLKGFENATVTFNGQNATKKVLIDAGFAYAIYELPPLTGQDSSNKITELAITISNYQIGKKIADLVYGVDNSIAEAISLGGDEEIESRVTMDIFDSESSAMSIWGVGSKYTLTTSHKYVLYFTIKAKDGVSFYNLTENDVTVTALKKFREFNVSAGGGYLEFTAELRLLSDYHEHDFVNEEIASALKTSATCENNAVYYMSCSCGELSTQTFVKENSKLGHSIMSEWTLTDNGHYHACSNAGCNHQEDFASHTPNISEATESEASVCSICGYVLQPTLSHTHSLTLHQKVDATCLANGTKAYFYCDGCENKFEDENALSPISNFETWVVLTGEHNFGNLQDEVPATCISNGTKAHKTCSTCHKNFDASNNEMLNINIRKLPHEFDTEVEKVWPTCIAVGTLSHRHCSLCNKNYDFFESELTDTTIPTNSRYHSYEFVNAQPATCLADGVISHYKCSECNKLFNSAIEEISAESIVISHDANAHKFTDWIEEVLPTCVKSGAIAHKDCIYCHKHYDQNGEEIIEENLIIAVNENAHNFTDWIEEIPATTENEGIKAHKDCQNCHKHFDENNNEMTDLKISKLENKLSTMAIVCMVLGGTITIGICGFVVYWCAIKKRKFKSIFSIFTRKKI